MPNRTASEWQIARAIHRCVSRASGCPQLRNRCSFVRRLKMPDCQKRKSRIRGGSETPQRRTKHLLSTPRRLPAAARRVAAVACRDATLTPGMAHPYQVLRVNFRQLMAVLRAPTASPLFAPGCHLLIADNLGLPDPWLQANAAAIRQ